MIYFTLPNFNSNASINKKLLPLIHDDSLNYMLKYPIHFSYASGSFPYSYWNGGINNCEGILNLDSDFLSLSNNLSLSVRIDCSNINIYKDNFNDRMMQSALTAFNNGSNLIELTNLELYQYIKDKYNDFRFVFSENATLIKDITVDEFNVISENTDFVFITLNQKLNNDFEFLKSLSNRNKVELIVNNQCTCSLDLQKACHSAEQNYLYWYSNKSVIRTCEKRCKYSDSTIISIDDIIEKYLPLGINHFKLEEVSHESILEYYKFLANYFIKDCYRDKFLLYMLEGKIK